MRSAEVPITALVDDWSPPTSCHVPALQIGGALQLHCASALSPLEHHAFRAGRRAK